MNIFNRAKKWKEEYKSKTRNRINKKVEETLPETAGPNYSLIKEIKKTPYYKHSADGNDEKARAFITEHVEIKGSGSIQPGQLIMFEYFEPKTKEELEYYDASPCTIFFNVVKTPEGKRVLGFNIHYYPPKMRYNIMDKIFSIYKPIYTKYFKDGKSSSIDAFDYKYLIEALEKAGLGFGVRMYIPELIKKVRMIPPQLWHVAVFTEGWFKKQTRSAIMNYWQRWRKQSIKKTNAGNNSKMNQTKT